MRGVRCDYCDIFIEEGQTIYDDGISCGLYCSLLCCAKAKMQYKVKTLNDYEVSNHSLTWEEIEEK